MSREVMKQALEFIDANADSADERDIALALRQALETEQEPVAWIDRHELSAIDEDFSPSVGNRKLSESDVPLYTAPPQRKPLSDEEIYAIRDAYAWHLKWGIKDFARAIEAAHGIVENT